MGLLANFKIRTKVLVALLPLVLMVLVAALYSSIEMKQNRYPVQRTDWQRRQSPAKPDDRAGDGQSIPSAPLSGDC